MAKATDSPKTIYSAQALLCAFAIGTGCRKKKKREKKLLLLTGQVFGSQCAPPKQKSQLSTQQKNKVQVLKLLGRKKITKIHNEREAAQLHRINAPKDPYEPA